jgi:hypothetical protein
MQAVVPPPDGGYPGGNTAEGQSALFSLTSGGFNTAVGFVSLRSDSTSSFNTAVGAGTLFANTADQNTATGAGALFSNNTGAANTADGAFALFANVTGNSNTATGSSALLNNTNSFNTATGGQTLMANTDGNANTATGFVALAANTTGSLNTADGAGALQANTTGHFNTATGYQTLQANTEGSTNTADGFQALQNNTTGGGNLALGAGAGSSVSTASNVTCVGSGVAGADVSNTTWIANVYGVTTQSGTTAPVIVSNTGQLGTMSSSARFKKDIIPMDKTSEAILSLKPVEFHYKNDAKNTPQFGLIAEEVAKVDPDLVLLDRQGKPYSVRYEHVNAMLLNEFLKEHRAFIEEQHKIAQQQKEIDGLKAELKEQRSLIQKVTDKGELSQSATRLATHSP